MSLADKIADIEAEIKRTQKIKQQMPIYVY